MRKYKRLTDEEKAYIREHLLQSTYAQVARELDRRRNTVEEFAHKNGIKHSEAAARLASSANLRKQSSRDREARIKKMSKTRKEIFARERR